MKDPVLGLRSETPARDVSRGSTRAGAYGWRLAAWFGLLFVIIGLVDMALVWYPLRPGNPSWEFGAIDLAFSTLPVLTIGFAALAAGTVALNRRRTAWLLAVAALFGGLACIGAYLIFLTDVPLALRNSPAEVLTGVKKAIARNTVFGVAFSVAYLGAGIGLIRHLRRRPDA